MQTPDPRGHATSSRYQMVEVPTPSLVAVQLGCSRGFEVDLVAEQVTNVVEAVLDHRWTLKRETPGDDTHVLWQAHWTQHFWTEDTRVTDFGPLVEVWVEREDLHTWLGVWVVGWLETHLGDANLVEERLDDTNEIAQTQVVVRDDTFDLVELGQVRGIHAFVTEDTIDREVLLRREATWLVRELVEHLGRNSRRVRTQNVLHRRLALERTTAVTNRAETTVLVHVVHTLVVVFRDRQAALRFREEESIVGITSWVRLRLEERVEVPEAALDEAVRWHLVETHVHQHTPELRAHLHEWVQLTTTDGQTHRVEVVWLERLLLPGVTFEHLLGQASRLLLTLKREVGALGELVRLARAHLDEVTTLEVLGLVTRSSRKCTLGRFNATQDLRRFIHHRLNLIAVELAVGLVETDPPVLHTRALAHLEGRGADRLFQRRAIHTFSRDGVEHLHFWRSVLQEALGFVLEHIERGRDLLAHHVGIHKKRLHDTDDEIVRHLLLQRELEGVPHGAIGVDGLQEKRLHALLVGFRAHVLDALRYEMACAASPCEPSLFLLAHTKGWLEAGPLSTTDTRSHRYNNTKYEVHHH